MGKKKQSKLYKLQPKSNPQKRQQMELILKKLSANKKLNSQIVPELNSIANANHKNKPIQKKPKKKKILQQFPQQQIQQQMPLQDKPKINIFQTQFYQSEQKTVIKAGDKFHKQKNEELDLQSKVRKVMGDQIAFEKFGEKPLKVIEEEDNEKIEQENIQLQKMHNRAHPSLRIPEGSTIIKRKAEIQQFRKQLPIYMKQQEIIQTVSNNLVTLVCGETGSGKSTQLPQFLIEKNYHKMGKIAITQPRRLATIALARRVAEQLNWKIGKQVGYQVRHDRKDSPQGIIKFMTDGILLKQMNSDFLLKEYSIIIIDEAHERKVNTDILIGLLSRLILIRYKLSLEDPKINPLRLIIMSATMRVADFQNKKLFDFDVPVLNVQARMFPVTIFHEKNTPQNYIQAAIKKCIKIHQRLPQGDVLVFLTGKDEIHEASIQLETMLNSQGHKYEQDSSLSQMDVQLPQQMKQGNKTIDKFVIYKLYSSLPADQQIKIFRKQEPGTRKFIFSTNIAETSITIPNIRYVIDSGYEKHRYFQGVWKWYKGWGSKAMANQRSGRAGRTSHGFCYRLYSSALYANIMQEFPAPQIKKIPLDQIVLQIKSIGIQNIYSFPFPTIPQNKILGQALQKLIQIGALAEGTIKQNAQNTKITALGEALSYLPIDPRLGKMLLVAKNKKLQKYMLYCVGILTVQEIIKDQKFGKHYDDEDLDKQDFKKIQIEKKRIEVQAYKKKYAQFMNKSDQSDLFMLINIVGQFFTSIYKNSKSANIQKAINAQCKRLSLNENCMRQLYYNMDQIGQIYETLTNLKIQFQNYSPPSLSQKQMMLDIFLCSYPQNVCCLEQKNRYKDKNKTDVFIQSKSSLYMKGNLFVGCIDFISTNRKYMKYPFLIKDYELLASFGQVQPVKQYIWKNESIVGKTKGFIHGFQIPSLIVADAETPLKYYYVARFLLDGTIVQPFKALSKYINAPTSIIKPDNLNIKVQKLVNIIKKFKITSRDILIQNLNKDSKFLKEELRLWINMNQYDQAYQKIRTQCLKR